MLHYSDLLNLKNEKACVQTQSFQTNLHKEIQIKLCGYRKTLINFMLCIQCGCSSYISIIFGLHIRGRLHFCSVLFVVTLSSFLVCTAASYFFTYFYALSHSCCTHCFHQTITLFILLCFCFVSVLCWLLLLHRNFMWLLIVAAWSLLACVWTDCTHVGKANPLNRMQAYGGKTCMTISCLLQAKRQLGKYSRNIHL